MVRFVEKKTDEPTWVIKKGNFGRFIPNLHLDMLEIKQKLKPNAPIIPDSTYQGDAFTPEEPELPPPAGGPQPEVEEESAKLVVEDELESRSYVEVSGGTRSDDEERPEYTAKEMEVLDRFAETPPQRMASPEASSVEHIAHSEPRYIPTEEPMHVEESVEDEEDRYARELVEKRRLVEFLKEKDIEFSPDDSLRILRALKEDHEEQQRKKGALTVNRMVLGCMMWGCSEGMEWFDPTLQGYLDYQMKLMPMYEGVLEEFDDLEISDMIMDLPASAKLAGGIAVSSALFVAMKKYNIENKLRQSKFLETIIPGYGKAVDRMTQASRETKQGSEPAADSRRRRRGPSVKAQDIKRM